MIDFSNREPVQLGKPSKLFGEFAMKRAGVTDPTRVLFIGDMYVFICIYTYYCTSNLLLLFTVGITYAAKLKSNNVQNFSIQDLKYVLNLSHRHLSQTLDDVR